MELKWAFTVATLMLSSAAISRFVLPTMRNERIPAHGESRTDWHS